MCRSKDEGGCRCNSELSAGQQTLTRARISFASAAESLPAVLPAAPGPAGAVGGLEDGAPGGVAFIDVWSAPAAERKTTWQRIIDGLQRMLKARDRAVTARREKHTAKAEQHAERLAELEGDPDLAEKAAGARAAIEEHGKAATELEQAEADMLDLQILEAATPPADDAAAQKSLAKLAKRRDRWTGKLADDREVAAAGGEKADQERTRLENERLTYRRNARNAKQRNSTDAEYRAKIAAVSSSDGAFVRGMGHAAKRMTRDVQRASRLRSGIAASAEVDHAEFEADQRAMVELEQAEEFLRAEQQKNRRGSGDKRRAAMLEKTLAKVSTAKTGLADNMTGTGGRLAAAELSAAQADLAHKESRPGHFPEAEDQTERGHDRGRMRMLRDIEADLASLIQENQAGLRANQQRADGLQIPERERRVRTRTYARSLERLQRRVKETHAEMKSVEARLGPADGVDRARDRLAEAELRFAEAQDRQRLAQESADTVLNRGTPVRTTKLKLAA